MAIYWVDVILGDNGNDGSYATPKKSFKAAASLVTSNDDEVRIMSNLFTCRSQITANITYNNDSVTINTETDLSGSVSAGDLIGKLGAAGNGAEETFYYVNSVDSDSINLDSNYFGLEETVTGFYIIKPDFSGDTADEALLGTPNNYNYTVSGGWTSETERLGETWLKPFSGWNDGDCHFTGNANGVSAYMTGCTVEYLNGISYKLYDNYSYGVTFNYCSINIYHQICSTSSSTLTSMNNIRIVVDSRQYLAYGNNYEFIDCVISSNGSGYFHFGMSYRGHKFVRTKLYGLGNGFSSFSYNYGWTLEDLEFHYCTYCFYQPLSGSYFNDFKANNCNYILNASYNNRGLLIEDFEAYNSNILYAQYAGNILFRNFLFDEGNYLLYDSQTNIATTNISFVSGTIQNVSSSLLRETSINAKLLLSDLTIDEPIYLNIDTTNYNQSVESKVIQNIEGLDKFKPLGRYCGNSSVTQSNTYVSTYPGIAIINFSNLSGLNKYQGLTFYRKYINSTSSDIDIRFKYKMDAGWIAYNEGVTFVAKLNGAVIKEWTENSLSTNDIVVDWNDMCLALDSTLLTETGLLEISIVARMNAGYKFYIDEVSVA